MFIQNTKWEHYRNGNTFSKHFLNTGLMNNGRHYFQSTMEVMLDEITMMWCTTQ